MIVVVLTVWMAVSVKVVTAVLLMESNVVAMPSETRLTVVDVDVIEIVVYLVLNLCYVTAVVVLEVNDVIQSAALLTPY